MNYQKINHKIRTVFNDTKVVNKKLEDIGRPNLNPYIKDDFQDVQYFLNADFHQDMQTGKILHTICLFR